MFYTVDSDYEPRRPAVVVPPARPERRFRRRFPLLLGLVVAAHLAVGWVPAATSSRFDVAQAKVLVARTERLLREPLPDYADLLLRQLAATEPKPLDRWSDKLAAALGRAEVDATVWDPVIGSCFRGLRARTQLSRQGEAAWAGIAPGVTQAVVRARLAMAEPGMGRREHAWFQEAEGQLEMAQRHAVAARWNEAVAAAERAKKAASRISASHHTLYVRFRDPAHLRMWRRWYEEAVAESRRSSDTVLVVHKLERRLEVFRKGHAIATFRVELGSRGLVRKLHSGDKATPEGRYRVVERKVHPRTKYYKALLIDYPNREDLDRLQRSRKEGRVPGRVGAGNLIEIHGDGGRGKDWTDGCVALTNEDMDRLFRLLSAHTSVTIIGTLRNYA